MYGCLSRFVVFSWYMNSHHGMVYFLERCNLILLPIASKYYLVSDVKKDEESSSIEGTRDRIS